MVGSASIKIKGSAFSNGTSSNGTMIVWDSYDVGARLEKFSSLFYSVILALRVLVYPPTELNAFFVSTAFHRTVDQQQGAF